MAKVGGGGLFVLGGLVLGFLFVFEVFPFCFVGGVLHTLDSTHFTSSQETCLANSLKNASG